MTQPTNDQPGMDDQFDFAAIYHQQQPIRYPLLQFLREYVLQYPLLFIFNRSTHFTLAALMVVPPYLLGVAIDILVEGPEPFSILFLPDRWLPTDPVDQFIVTVGLLAAVALLSALLTLLTSWTKPYLIEWPKHDFRMDVFDQTQRLGMEFFDSAQTGDVMSVLNNDTRQLGGTYDDLVMPLTWWAATNGGALIVMLALHWQFTLILLALLTPVGIISHVFDERVAPQHAEVRAQTGQLNARIENSISGIETVKTTANEAYERERVRSASKAHRDAAWEVSKTQAIYSPLAGLSTHMAAVVAFITGAWWVVFGPPLTVLAPLSLGVFVTFFFYMRNFTDSVRRLVNFIDRYRNFTAAAQRVYGLRAVPLRVPEARESTTFDEISGRVEYTDVTFGYREDQAPAIRNVSFEISPREHVGIVGPTGAGKTTLMKLLIRFYDPDLGTIRVDGHDLRDMDIESLRTHIGYVSQEPLLFDGTVEENIAYADPTATEAEIISVAKRANAHEFIADLDEGYQTRIGERGIRLSGGQRQRIAIARALLKDPAILILDEATSHVDNETEYLIQEALEDLIADRTTFAIAHSLATVRDVDHLLVMENGEIVERGTHEELLATGGLYATLWNVHIGETSTPDEFLAGGTDA